MAVSSVKATINGTEYTLSYNSTSGKYEATITAPSTSSYNQTGHYYGVSVTATDDAGNTTTIDSSDSTFGQYLQLVVKEKVAPVSTITYPTSSATIITNLPTITWTVTDNDSGVDPATIGITIDSGSKITGSGITKTAITGGYSCSYTPSSALTDGPHVIAVDAKDYDGNLATTKSIEFKVDTVPPTLSVTTPTEGFITNESYCEVTGVTNDATSSPVTLTVQLNSDTPATVTVAQDGSFSASVTLAEGNNTITVVSTDGAGQATTVTRHAKLSTVAPTFQSVSIVPNPVDSGATYIISVEVTDD